MNNFLILPSSGDRVNKDAIAFTAPHMIPGTDMLYTKTPVTIAFIGGGVKHISEEDWDYLKDYLV